MIPTFNFDQNILLPAHLIFVVFSECQTGPFTMTWLKPLPFSKWTIESLSNVKVLKFKFERLFLMYLSLSILLLKLTGIVLGIPLHLGKTNGLFCLTQSTKALAGAARRQHDHRSKQEDWLIPAALHTGTQKSQLQSACGRRNSRWSEARRCAVTGTVDSSSRTAREKSD